MVADSRNGALDLIWAQRRNHLQAIAQLRDRRTMQQMTPATKLVLEGAILRAEADLRWLDLSKSDIRKGLREAGRRAMTAVEARALIEDVQGSRRGGRSR